jgi:hypothetical protein
VLSFWAQSLHRELDVVWTNVLPTALSFSNWCHFYLGIYVNKSIHG